MKGNYMYITQQQQHNILYKQYISKHNLRSFNVHMSRLQQLLLNYSFLSCFTTVPAQINRTKNEHLPPVLEVDLDFFEIFNNCFLRIVFFLITSSTYWRCWGRINYRQQLNIIIWQSLRLDVYIKCLYTQQFMCFYSWLEYDQRYTLRLDFVIVRTVSSNQCSCFFK